MTRPRLLPPSLALSLLVLTAMRLAVAGLAPLSADEAYYWTWSHALAPGYPDHPPMVAVWIRLGTALVGETAFGIRLLGPLSALAGSLLLARAAEDLAPGRNAGPAAVMLLNATLLLNAGSVVMTPDTPLLFFWTASLAALSRLIRTGNPSWWLAVGLAAGLALDSKYTAILLAPALLAWLLVTPSARPWLRCRQLWAGAAVAALLFLPVIAWNAHRGWVSFARQGGRTGAWHPYDALRFMGELLAGQVGLATPLVFCLLCLGVWRAVGPARRGAAEAGLLVAIVTVPGVVFLQHALGDRVQANWPAILYPGASVAAAIWVTRFWLPASLSGIAVVLVVFAQAAFAPLALPRPFDFTLIRLAGWSDIAGAAYVAREEQHADFVAADEYGLASELAFRLSGLVVSQEKRWSLFDLPTTPISGRPGILVCSLRQPGEPDRRLWPTARLIGTADRGRAGILAERYRLYLVTGGEAPGIALPHRISPPAS